jgi:hypothetical protein
MLTSRELAKMKWIDIIGHVIKKVFSVRMALWSFICLPTIWKLYELISTQKMNEQVFITAVEYLLFIVCNLLIGLGYEPLLAKLGKFKSDLENIAKQMATDINNEFAKSTERVNALYTIPIPSTKESLYESDILKQACENCGFKKDVLLQEIKRLENSAEELQALDSKVPAPQKIR